MPLIRTHELKTHPEPFAALLAGEKTHEIRQADRDYLQGDDLRLREWDPTSGLYTGRQLLVRVTHVSEGGTLGLPAGLCVMSVRPIQDARSCPMEDLAASRDELADLVAFLEGRQRDNYGIDTDAYHGALQDTEHGTFLFEIDIGNGSVTFTVSAKNHVQALHLVAAAQWLDGMQVEDSLSIAVKSEARMRIQRFRDDDGSTCSMFAEWKRDPSPRVIASSEV